MIVRVDLLPSPALALLYDVEHLFSVLILIPDRNILDESEAASIANLMNPRYVSPISPPSTIGSPGIVFPCKKLMTWSR